MSGPPANSPVLLIDGRLMVPLMGHPLGLWEGLRLAYLAQRPATRDTIDPDAIVYPETTHGDVAQIVERWAIAIRRDYRAGVDYTNARAAWDAYTAALAVSLRDADPAARFAGNRDFWLRHSYRLALALGAMYQPPTSFAQAVESTKEAIEQGARTALGLSTPALAVKALDRAGDALEGAAGGLWRAVRVPLLVGAAVVGVIVLAPHVLPRRDRAGGA